MDQQVHAQSVASPVVCRTGAHKIGTQGPLAGMIAAKSVTMNAQLPPSPEPGHGTGRDGLSLAKPIRAQDSERVDRLS